MSRPRVLFVSKAVAPPFHDGATCLVRDLCAGLSRCDATVMTTRDGPELRTELEHARIYTRRSRFAPPFRDNARVFAHVLTDRRHDIWHFVFAPNPVSSFAGRALRRLRRTPIVQTIASRPRSFDRVDRLLFGDRIVALSRHTADRLVDAGVPRSRALVIPPPVADLARDASQRSAARRSAGIAADVPFFVYPGDLEFSGGAATVARAVPGILRGVPDAVVVFACRAKTERALGVRRQLAEQLTEHGSRALFLGEVHDLPALLADAAAVLFPVDDLYGKVDLPYAVLEACLLRAVVIVADRGPLAEIAFAPRVAPSDEQALVQHCVRLARDERERGELGSQLREAVLASCSPRRVAEAYEQLYDELSRAT